MIDSKIRQNTCVKERKAYKAVKLQEAEVVDEVDERSSKSKREGLDDGSETCCDEWFGESGTDRKRHIEISSKILVKINTQKLLTFLINKA